MVRILILLLGALSQRREARYQMAMASTTGTG